MYKNFNHLLNVYLTKCFREEMKGWRDFLNSTLELLPWNGALAWNNQHFHFHCISTVNANTLLKFRLRSLF
jgi:hypothetical protein